MEFINLQRDMRRAYVNGGLGVLVSGIVWVVAGLVSLNITLQAGMAALFFGGVAIHPLSLLLEKLTFKREKSTASNPLEMLALQTTPFLIIGLVVAYVVNDAHAEWFFAIALLAVGGRYLVFQTIYGIPHYVALGATLIAVGFASIWFLRLPPYQVAVTGGIIELLFAVAILQRKEPAV